MSKVATKSNITLKGSVEIVTEFFGYSINSILYQRGIYPPETFRRVNKYGLTMLVTTDDALNAYLENVLKQLSQLLAAGSVQKLVVVVTGQQTQETLERWVFDVHTDKSVGPEGKVEKSQKEITSEIQAIIRQITASVTFLPLLDEPCTFDLLVYTDNDVDVPQAWEESDPRYIANSDEVKLRSFTTKVHRVDACVSYKADA
jgi:mitotic spindle assembly checkpoint protein MAD2